MTNIKQTIEQLKEIYQWNSYMNKQRFTSYAKAKYPFTDKEAEQVWNVWELLASQNLYQLEDKSEGLILTAMNIAREAYEAVCRGGRIHWRENEPETTRWRIYYRHGEEGEIQQMDLNLLEKGDVLRYALLLQQENTKILYRVDFYERVQVSCGTSGTGKRMEVDIYDGDIIFCTDKEKFFTWGDESGAYLCIDGCYKRLMYTPGRGYLRRGEPDFEQNKYNEDCRYSNYIFNSYDRKFQIVGNIFVDNTALNERKKEEAK